MSLWYTTSVMNNVKAAWLPKIVAVPTTAMKDQHSLIIVIGLNIYYLPGLGPLLVSFTNVLRLTRLGGGGVYVSSFCHLSLWYPLNRAVSSRNPLKCTVFSFT